MHTLRRHGEVSTIACTLNQETSAVVAPQRPTVQKRPFLELT
jgi:CTP-dependent riboflavin kinase